MNSSLTATTIMKGDEGLRRGGENSQHKTPGDDMVANEVMGSGADAKKASEAAEAAVAAITAATSTPTVVTNASKLEFNALEHNQENNSSPLLKDDGGGTKEATLSPGIRLEGKFYTESQGNEKKWRFDGKWFFGPESKGLDFKYVWSDASEEDAKQQIQGGESVNENGGDKTPATKQAVEGNKSPMVDKHAIGAKLIPPESGLWNGSFSNIVKKRSNEVIQDVPEKFEMKVEKTSKGYTASGNGKNRFGKFQLEGELDPATGDFKGWKKYARPSSSFDGSPLEPRELRHSRRASRRQGNGPSSIPEAAEGSGGVKRERPDDFYYTTTWGDVPGDKRRRALKKVKEFIRSIKHREIHGRSNDSASNGHKSASRTPSHSKPNGPSKANLNNLTASLALAKEKKISISDHVRKLIAGWNSVTKEYMCPNGVLEHGEVYEGLSKNGIRHGYGVCAFATGHVYEGDWANGRATGKGILTNPKGEIVYQGEFLDNKINGCGTYFFESGDRYDGEFREGMMHGWGIYQEHATGSRYEGEWARNKRHGQGNFTQADNSYYEGEWYEDIWQGRGKLHIEGHYTYEGTFKNGKMEGRGVCQYVDGGRYEGNWRAGVKDGRGSYIFTNGAVYEGRFRGDKMDGTGTLKMVSDKPIQISSEEWAIPINYQSEIRFVHLKAGFSEDGS